MNIHCRICDGEAVNQRWGGSVCTLCGSISITDLPGSEELERYYLKFNQDYHGGGRAKGAKARQLRYAYAYLKPLLALNSGKRLLDIGSSTNPFPNITVVHGFDVTVIDYLKPVDIDSRVRFVMGNVEDENVFEALGEHAFDLVTAFQVIEHSRNPKLMAEQMVRFCDDNGYIVVATPLVNSFSERNALGKTPWFNPPEHIHMLSREGTIRLFESLGCELVSACRYELNPFRWLLRYGQAYLEGLSGLIVKTVAFAYWQEARAHKTSHVQEYIYFIFRNSRQND